MKQLDLAPAEEQARQVLVLAMRLFDVTDNDLATRLGWKYQSVQQRRKGYTRIKLGDVDLFSEALEVPPELFTMDLPDAASWVFANRLEQVIAHSRCTARFPVLASAAA